MPTEKAPTVSISALALTEFNLAAVKSLAGARNGVVIFGLEKRHEAKFSPSNSLSLLRELRPEAKALAVDSATVAKEVLAQAATDLVFIGSFAEDPVEAIYEFLGNFSADSELREKAVSLIRGAFLHRSIRQSCAACARGTVIDPLTVEKLPEVLRPEKNQSYMFGRGCEQCGHSAYSGTTGVESAVVIDSELAAILKRGGSTQEFTLAAYKKGTRSLLEDGLAKIFAGRTSFESMFQAITRISPAFEAAIKQLRNEQLAAKHSAPAEVPSGQKRVLIIEDDRDQRGVLEAVFQSEGFSTQSAEHGKEALSILKTHTVDIVVCDLMMPVMGGADFIKLLRQDSALVDLPVLMLTAVATPEAEIELLTMGADDFCNKNVRKKVLLTRVERLLARTKRVAAPSGNPIGHLLQD